LLKNFLQIILKGQKRALCYWFLTNFAVGILAVTPSTGIAALSLSANPIDGGNSLRWGRVGTTLEENKEVRIRVSASEGKQYQVYQRMVEPLVNERGISLGPDAILTYGLIGSNSTGTLYLQTPENFGFGDQLVYTSGADGDSDSFTVVYSASADRLGASGSFSGRIGYTIRSDTQDTVYLNVYLDAFGELKIDLQGSTSQDRVRLSCSGVKTEEGYIQISYSGNVGEPIKIYQEVETLPQNESFEAINQGLLKFMISEGAQGESYYQTSSDLDEKRILIYSSEAGEDTIRVNFAVQPEDVDNQKAGLFSGKLRYIVERMGTEKDLSAHLEVEVKPVFNIDVQLPPEGVSFSKLLPTSEPQMSEVYVTVKSNLGKPYMVIQDVVSVLTNEKGHEIDKEYFSMKGELVETDRGKMVMTEFAPVEQGEAPIFFSDQKGSSAKFKMFYRLRPYATMEAGDYSSAIIYSLGEM